MPNAPEQIATVKERDCLLAVADGEVIGVGPLEDLSWHADPHVTEVVRMPVAAAGRFLFKPWPGRAAALAILKQEEAGNVD